MPNKLVGIAEKVLAFCIIAFSLAIIALLVVGATHAHSNVEDIELALIARDIGIFDSWIHLSITYDGRYSTNMLQSINPLVFDKVLWYKYIIVFTLALFTTATYILSATIFSSYSKLQKLLVTLIFVSGFFLLNPSLAHSLYWMGSSFVYLFSCIFFFFSLAGVIAYTKITPAGKKNSFLPLALLLFVSIGFSESFLPVYLLSSVFMVFYYLKHRKDALQYIIPVAIVMLASIIFMISTPGLGMRFQQPIESYFQQAVFKASVVNYITFLVNTVNSSAFWLVVAVAFYINLTSRSQSGLLIKTKWHLPVAILSALLIVYLMTLPFYVTKSYTGEMPLRIYIPVLFLLSFFLLYVLVPSVNFHYPLNYHLKPVLYPFLALLLLLSTYQLYNGKGPVGLLLTEYRNGELKKFDQFMTLRYSKLQVAVNSADSYKLVCLGELKDYPKSLYTYPDSEINRHNSKWHKFMEAYFKIDEVKVLGDSTLRFTRLNIY
jgi:hypothetical protein